MPKSKEFVTDSSGSDSGSEDEKPKAKKQKTQGKPAKKEKEKDAKDSGPIKGDNGEFMFELSPMRFVTLSEFRGKTFVGIREFYEKDGKKLPGKKGISLTKEQWQKLKDKIDDIDNCLEENF